MTSELRTLLLGFMGFVAFGLCCVGVQGCIAYQQGYRDYKDGRPIETNPWAGHDYTARRRWFDGWLDAQKESAE